MTDERHAEVSAANKALISIGGLFVGATGLIITGSYEAFNKGLDCVQAIKKRKQRRKNKK